MAGAVNWPGSSHRTRIARSCSCNGGQALKNIFHVCGYWSVAGIPLWLNGCHPIAQWHLRRWLAGAGGDGFRSISLHQLLDLKKLCRR
ncbi:hypothetical protein AVEN_164657-1 [Araneus ventricosus]|uniref:Uncharacterized protein n=1 Tax=Araneus ventricosus TaxID=182803 RepID=A0A4Y2W9H7_ARAVE|nr:hypothetical protein AVEN_164657-1 [Araneus ventricosus]